MASIFSKIVAGEIPSYKVAEDDNCMAFLDIFPVAKGHVLVIPKKEVDYLFDLDKDSYRVLMEFVRKVSRAMDKTIDCKRIGVAVLGLEVPHAHVHLVPLNSEKDIDFSKPKLQFSSGEFAAIAKQIADSFSNLPQDF